MSRPTEAAPAIIYKDGSDIILNGEVFDPDAVGSSLTKATSSDVIAGTDDEKYVTSLAIADSGIGIPVPTYYAPFIVTHAQTLTLPTTGITVVSAIPDIIFIPRIGWIHANWVADYTNIDAVAILDFALGTDHAIMNRWQESENVVSSILAGGGSTGTNAHTAPRYPIVLGSTTGAFSAYDSDWANKAITLTLDNGSSGDLTGGNVGNSLTGYVEYQKFNIVTGLLE